LAQNRIEKMILEAEQKELGPLAETIGAALSISHGEKNVYESVCMAYWAKRDCCPLTKEELDTLEIEIKRWDTLSPSVKLVLFLVMQRLALLDIDDIIKFGNPPISRTTNLNRP